MKIVLYAYIYPIQFNDDIKSIKNDIIYSWNINDTIKNTTEPNHIISPYSYKVNDIVKIKLTVGIVIKNKKYYFEKIDKIKFKEKPLIGIVDSDNKSLSISEKLIIDASKSWDPNTNKSVLKHKWKCYNATSKKICIFDININWNLPILKLPPNILINSELFLFYDYITSLSIKKYQKIIVQVNINQKQVPTVSFDVSTKELFNQNESIKMIAYVTSNEDYLSNEWYFIEKDNYFTDTYKLSDYFTSVITQKNKNKCITDKHTDLFISLPPIDVLYNIIKIKNSNTLSCEDWNKKVLTIQLKSSNKYGYGYAQKSFKINCQPMKNVIFLNTKNIVALQTILRATINEKWINNDYLPLFKFGIRTYFKNGTINDFYGEKSSFNKFSIILPSTTNIFLPMNCNNRVSFQIIIQICNSYEACMFGESEIFTVQSIKNKTDALEKVIHLVKKDINKKRFFDALFKLRALKEEFCDQVIKNDVIINTYEKLLMKLKEYNEKDKSSLISNDLFHFLNVLLQLENTKIFETTNTIKLKKLLYFNNNRIKKRSKRNINIPETTRINGNLSESAANTILIAYDVLLNKNQDIADVYLQNINDIIKIFCNDTNIDKEKKATGGLYTFIQTQVLMPNNESIIYKNMTMAGSDKFMFSLDEQFNNLLYQNRCGMNSNNMCKEVCIGTSLIGIGGLEVNIYFRQRLFSTNNLLASYNNLVSELRHVYIIDPFSGIFLNIPPYTIWNAQIPLHNYSSSNYYSCMLYLTSLWDSFNSCTTNDYAYVIENSTKSFINCTCSGNGIIGVFQIPPPKPQPYSIYEEILLSFKLSSPVKCDPIKLSKFFSSLSLLTSVPINRFIRQKCTTNKINDTIFIILRPLMKDNDQSNAYVIQSIERLINSPNGLEFSDKIKVLSVLPNPIKRNLTNDRNARQVRITIEKKFNDVVFNETLIIGMWIKDISNSLGMSQYRIKNPQLFEGIIIQFTITVPFEGEISLIGQILSAEELSQILLEQTTYGELILKDLHDEVLPIKVMKQNDITELIVLYQASTLLVILGSVVGGLLLITIFGILGLVIIKIRTDQLIAAASNNDVVTVNLNNINRTTVTSTPQTIFVDQNSIVQ